jgi:formate C-acetyltransferase
MNTRIKKLRERLMNESDRAIFLERLLLLEEAYEKFKDISPGKRYAMCFNHVLSHMSVEIAENELIVGKVKEIIPNEEEESLFLQKAEERYFSSLELFTFDPLNLIEIKDVGPKYAPPWFNSWGHLTVSWEDLLHLGFEGIRQKAEGKLQELKNKHDEKALAKKDFLESVIIACHAMAGLGRRYAARAEELASLAQNEQRRQELLTIARICSKVPERPAENFWEALQSIWFTLLVLHCVCGARDYGLGRFDMYLYPFYKLDLERGILDREKALELLECFFIKQNEIIGRGVENYTPKRILSVNSLQYLIIGGMDMEGNDASNTLSELILEGIDELELKQPTVVVRYHPKLNRKLFHRACEVAKRGLGYLSFYNDVIVIKALKNMGVKEQDAMNYVHYGCLNPNIPGKEDELREAWHNLPKYLEFALNEGKCLLTGRRMGVSTRPVDSINNFEELLENLRVQIRHGVHLAVKKVEESDEKWKTLKPFSFESVLLHDCIERAEDCTNNGVVYKHMNNHAVGIATVANSLAVLKKMVFEDKRYTLREFREILKSNFKGYEALREEVLNKFPKYGNDLTYVDSIAQEVGRIFCEEVRNASPVPGSNRQLWPSFYSLWHHREMGKYTAATADGRLAGEPLSESQSPVYDTEKYGPTAALNTLAKLPFHLTPGGGVNVKLQPGMLKGDKGTLFLASLIEGYFAQGGLEIQLNVVDRSVLLEAKKNPDRHRNLLVRVVGYSAYFVTLSPEQQDEIIARSEL